MAKKSSRPAPARVPAKISEQPLEAKTLQSLADCADDALQILGLATGKGGKKSKAALTPHDALTAHDIVKAVDQCVYDLQQGQGPKFGAADEPDLVLGSLWGQQLVREFSWQWAAVTFHEHDDAKAVGVFSPDRALAIYPFHFIYGCLENGAEVTIMLAFNLLVDGSKVPPLAPGTYENVMDNVHYIVPRG